MEELAQKRRQSEKKALAAESEANDAQAENKHSEESIIELESLKDTKSQRIRELESTIEKITEREYQERERLEQQVEALNRQLAQVKNNAQTDQKAGMGEPPSKLVESTSKTEKDPPPILMARVKPTQIAPIGRYLRLNLTTKRYSHDRWKSELFSNEDTMVSTKLLTEKLQM